MVLQDDQSEVLDLLLLEFTFLWLEKQPLPLEGSKDLADNPLVFGEGGGVDEDVIHVAYDFATVNELTKDVIHHHLEHCRGVAQSEEHDSQFKQASVSLECGLPLIALLDPHIVEPPAEVEYGEELGTTEAGQDIRDEEEVIKLLLFCRGQGEHLVVREVSPRR